MSVLDRKSFGSTVFYKDTKVPLARLGLVRLGDTGGVGVAFKIHRDDDGVAVLPALEATEFGVALIMLAQGVNARGFPRCMGISPERIALQELIEALEKSPHESTPEQERALATARATLDEIAAEEEGIDEAGGES